MEGLLVGADLHLRVHIISLRALHGPHKSGRRQGATVRQRTDSPSRTWAAIGPSLTAGKPSFLEARRTGDRRSLVSRVEFFIDAPARRSSSESSRAGHSEERRTSNRRAYLEFCFRC